MDSRKIIIEGKKPKLIFTCIMCSTKWEHEKWYSEEKPNIFGAAIFSIHDKVDLPTSRCPVCNIKSQNFTKQKEEKKEGN